MPCHECLLIRPVLDNVLYKYMFTYFLTHYACDSPLFSLVLTQDFGKCNTPKKILTFLSPKPFHLHLASVTLGRSVI